MTPQKGPWSGMFSAFLTCGGYQIPGWGWEVLSSEFSVLVCWLHTRMTEPPD